MEELTRIDEAEGRLAREQGNILLQAAAERLKAAGVRSETCHRHGGIIETVIGREAEADLGVTGHSGASADFAKGHLGRKLERMGRQRERKRGVVWRGG